MPRRSEVAVVIPALNPGLELGVAVECATSIGLPVVVVDDGSADADAVRALVPDAAAVIRMPDRQGQAAAINAGLSWAAERGANAVITLDQDTHVPSEFLLDLITRWETLQTAGTPVAALAPARFGPFGFRSRTINGLEVVDEVPQSGALFALEPLLRIGGFDQSLVVDGVDSDACLRLSDIGLPIVITPETIDHVIGSGRTLRVGRRQILVSDHSPERRYYMTRNRMRLIARHGRRHPRWAARIARAVVVSSTLALTIEEQRLEKTRAIVRGTTDAILGRTGLREVSTG